MATITVPYKILADGYEITGDVRNGLHATVPYLLAWTDAVRRLSTRSWSRRRRCV